MGKIRFESIGIDKLYPGVTYGG